VEKSVYEKNKFIQKLRALAVVSVILYHADFPIQNGFLGVDIFFVISGFVITQSLLRREIRNLKQPLIEFYARRIARLFPSFFLVYIVSIFLLFAFYSPNSGVQQNGFRTAVGALFGSSNIVLMNFSRDYFGANNESNPFLHTWSLSLEEQFYFVFPIFFILFYLKLRRYRYLVIALVIFTFLSLLVGYFPHLIGLSPDGNYFAPLGRFWQFTIGVFFALLRDRKPPNFTLFANLIRFILLFFVIFFLITGPNSKIYFSISLVSLIISVGMLLYFAPPNSSPLEESPYSLVSNAIILVGNLSYSLYLWHWPILVTIERIQPSQSFLLRVAQLVFIYYISYLTYLFVEVKWSHKYLKTIRDSLKVLVTGTTLGIFILLLFFYGFSNGWGSDWALESHKVIARGCDSGTLIMSQCKWIVNKPTGNVILIGDSMSWSIGNAVIGAANSLGKNVQVFSKNGCSATLAPSESDISCTKWRQTVINFVSSSRPEVVVIANTKGNTESDLSGMGKMLELFVSNRIKTIFVLSTYGGDEFSSRRSVLFAPGERNRFFALGPKETLLKYMIDKKTMKSSFFDVLRTSDLLCRNNLCPNALGGKEFFTYEGHLSPYANKLLEPSFRALFKKDLAVP